ncbi:sialidase family protein [Actinocrispum wychmicini]|nr:sialidase family protein [Actinocrispum wychmicini]
MKSRIVTTAAVVLLLGGQAAAGQGVRAVSGPTPFAVGCATGSATLYRNAEVQPYLAVNPRNPRHLVGTYQEDRWSDVAAQGVVAVASFDGGLSWRQSTPRMSRCTGNTAFDRATDSWASIAPDGTAYLSTLSMSGAALTPGSVNGVHVTRSADGGVTWSDPVLLATGDENLFNDLPSVTADPTDARLVYVVWTAIRVIDPEHSVGPTLMRRSTDGGLTWQPATAVYDPGINAQTTANRLVVLPNGTLVNAFARYKEDPGTHEILVDIAATSSVDHGVTWSAPAKVADQRLAPTTDPETQAKVRDGGQLPQLAVDGRGTVYLTWQDSRFTNGLRNGIAVARSTDAGRTWSAPTVVNRDLSTQAFSSAVAAQRDGTVFVTYSDFRNNTADPATLLTDIWLATSIDGGSTWFERHVAGPFDMALAPRANSSYYLGDYHGLVATGRAVIPFFPMTTANSQNPTDIFVTSL